MDTTYTHKLENHIKVLQDTLEDLIYMTRNGRTAAIRRSSASDAKLQLDISKEWTADLLAEDVSRRFYGKEPRS
jgi:hypothetical protein